MNQDEAQKRQLKPIAKVVAYAEGGVEPEKMGLGPIPAIRTLVRFKKSNYSE
jgi:acetyl-CoA C-acetyltransferase